LKLLTATEWAGVAFTVALMMTMEAGFKLFNKVCKRQKKIKKHQDGSDDDVLSCQDETGSRDSSTVDIESDSNEESHDDNNVSVDDIYVDNVICEFDAQNQLYVFDMILSLHGTSLDHHIYREQRKGTKSFMEVFVVCLMKSKSIPCKESNGWKLQKFHDMLHILRDMKMFGSSQNWDASPGEHILLILLSNQQKRHSSFIDQVAQ